MKYTAGIDAAQKIFSGDEWKSARRLLPNGLSFKRNRKFNDKKATPTKKPSRQKRNARQNRSSPSSSFLLLP
jgi:hypothetical protein